MSSSRWERRRVAYYAKHEKACRACSSKEEIHLHHHTYNRLGHEHDDDLVPLCKTCHFLVHKLHKNSSRSLTSATKYFVESSGGTFRTSRIKKGKPTQRGRPGFVSRAKAAKMLGITKEDLPKGQKNFRQSLIKQWSKNPPAWLRNAVTGMHLCEGKRAVYQGKLSWARGKRGTLVQDNGVFWLDLDDMAGSRLAVTAKIVVPVRERHVV